MGKNPHFPSGPMSGCETMVYGNGLIDTEQGQSVPELPKAGKHLQETVIHNEESVRDQCLQPAETDNRLQPALL